MIRRFGSQKRIHFSHNRNVKITGDKCFQESPHPSAFGSVDMFEVMKAYKDIGFKGPMRPDHGRMIWGEMGRPGYGLYDRALAESLRKAGEGIGWIFQMGMGYTFYLPFAFYVTGLLCWGYTVVKLVTLGRMAGYGLGLMFMAGYALQLSHLTLMVVLGLMLLNLDRRRLVAVVGEPGKESRLATTGSPILGGQT